MRIALIQDYLRNGGTENQTLHIAEGLARAGVETHLIVFRRGGVLDVKAKESSFTTHFLTQSILKTDWFAPGLDALLSRLSIDVAVAMGRMANCHAGLLCRRNRSYKWVATFRTGKTIPWLQRRALQHAAHIVFNSHEALTRIKAQYGIDRYDSTVIYNGCIRKTKSDCQPAASDGPIRLLSASMFRPEKKQIRLLRICGKLPSSIDWRLTLAGDGSELDACVREADTLGIADRVEFPGLLPDPSCLYESSHIAIHASSKESLPNFLVEAQTFGLPVVAYDVDGVAETFINESSGFLVAHKDETTFTKKLAQLCESPDLRLQMSQAARDHAQLSFSPDAQLDAYINLFSKLI